jgi:hypothetical protein
MKCEWCNSIPATHVTRVKRPRCENGEEHTMENKWFCYECEAMFRHCARIGCNTGLEEWIKAKIQNGDRPGRLGFPGARSKRQV